MCANGYSPADGRVVAMTFGCGAHSETTQSAPVPVAQTVVDEVGYDEFGPEPVEETEPEAEAEPEQPEPVEETEPSPKSPRWPMSHRTPRTPNMRRCRSQMPRRTHEEDGTRGARGRSDSGARLLREAPPGVTVFTGTTSERLAPTCFSWDGQIDPQQCLNDAAQKAASGQTATLDVVPENVVGISVDPAIAEQGWYPSIAGQRLSQEAITETYFRFSFPRVPANPRAIRWRSSPRVSRRASGRSAWTSRGLDAGVGAPVLRCREDLSIQRTDIHTVAVEGTGLHLRRRAGRRRRTQQAGRLRRLRVVG